MTGTSLVEGRRNRLLRRVDWRFLLPDPCPARIVCYAGGDLRDGLELVASSVVYPDGSPEGDCDLAVAVNPSTRVLRDAQSRLRPGGMCYAEWSWVWPWSRKSIRASLASSGFEGARWYMPWRRPPRCRLWLPCDAPGAAAFFIGRPLPFTNPARRLAGLLLRRLVIAGFRFGATPLLCGVARKPVPGVEQGAGIANTLDLPEAGTPTEVTQPLAQRLRRPMTSASWLLLTGGQRAIAKVVGLRFAEPSSEPSVVVKMARVPESVSGLTQEAATLRALASTGAELTGVPRVLFVRQGSGTVTVGESLVRGMPLSAMLRSHNSGHWAGMAMSWLLTLAEHTRREDSNWAPRAASALVERFDRDFGLVADSGMLRATTARLGSLEGVPQVCEHRDFAPWNILVAPDGTLGALDWESSDLRGFPVLDLLYFLTYLGFALDRAGTLRAAVASYRKALRPGTPTGRIRQETVARYAEELRLSPAALQALRPLVWIIHSRSEHERFVADLGGPPPEAMLRRSLFLRLWIEEMRRD